MASSPFSILKIPNQLCPFASPSSIERTETPVSVAIYAGVMVVPAVLVLLLSFETRGKEITAAGH